jgi:hypothetical protein
MSLCKRNYGIVVVVIITLFGTAESRIIRMRNQTGYQMAVRLEYCQGGFACRPVAREFKIGLSEKAEVTIPDNAERPGSLISMSWQADPECQGRVRSDDLGYGYYVFKRYRNGSCYYEIGGND